MSEVAPEPVLDRHALSGLSYLLLGAFLGKLCLLLGMLVGARILGPDKWGAFSFVFALLFLIHLVSDFGFHTLLLRSSALKRIDKPMLIQVVGWRLALGASGSVLAGIWMFYPRDGHEVWVLFVLLVTSVGLRAYHATVRSIAQGAGHMAVSVLLDTVMYGVFLASSVACLLVYEGSESMGMAWLFGNVLCWVVAMVLVRRTLSVPLANRDAASGLQLLKSALPFVALSALVILFHRSDIVLLEYVRGLKEVGYYASAYQLFDAAALLPGTMATVLFPKMLRTPPERTGNILQFVGLFACVMGILAFLLGTFSSSVIHIIYGSQFAEAAPVLRILSLGLPFMGSTAILAHYLFAQGKEFSSLVSTSLCTVLKLGFAIYYIPRYGMFAASWVTILFLAINACLHIVLVRTHAAYQS